MSVILPLWSRAAVSSVYPRPPAVRVLWQWLAFNSHLCVYRALTKAAVNLSVRIGRDAVVAVLTCSVAAS